MTETELARAWLADRDAPCPACRYNLRGSPGAVCPECGVELALRLVAASTLAPRGPAAEAARVEEYLRTHDASCPRCHARLRGQPGPACPSCGLTLSVWLLKPRGLESVVSPRHRTLLLGCAGLLFGLLFVAAGVLIFLLIRLGP